MLLFNRFWTRKVTGPFERRTSGERVEYRIQLRLSCTILHGDEVKSKKKFDITELKLHENTCNKVSVCSGKTLSRR